MYPYTEHMVYDTKGKTLNISNSAKNTREARFDLPVFPLHQVFCVESIHYEKPSEFSEFGQAFRLPNRLDGWVFRELGKK